jgi:hypothetical protein
MHHMDGFIKWYSSSSSAQSHPLASFLWSASSLFPLFSHLSSVGRQNPKVIAEILSV